MYFVYIIESEKDKSCYVGQCNDIDDRLVRHSSGKNKCTRTKAPWKLIHTEIFKTRSESLKREKEIKNKKSRKYIEWLVNSPK